MSEFYDDSSKNMRDDMNRGADPEALADIGYEVPDHMLPDDEAAVTPDAQESTKATESPEKERIESVAKKTGNVICADCLHIVPCAHVGVRPDGSRYTRGY